MLGEERALRDIRAETLNRCSIGLETCIRGHGLSAELGWL